MKKIEIINLKPSELNHNFGNPRKCSKDKIEELKKSLEKYGDHDIIKIDEEKNIISGNQRIKAMIELGIDESILCKQLIGFSKNELKSINIESNKHIGEWDYDLLNEWENDIKNFNIELEYNFNKNEIKKPKKIEIIPYKKIHFLISVEVDKINEVSEILKQFYNIEGIEIEQSQN